MLEGETWGNTLTEGPLGLQGTSPTFPSCLGIIGRAVCGPGAGGGCTIWVQRARWPAEPHASSLLF